MRGLKDVILENWGLKLIALLLAVTLWLAVHGDPAAERTITVPLEILNQPRNLEITSDRPSSVQVTVRGSTASLMFGQAFPTCVIDLSSAREGEMVIPLGPENVRIPRSAILEVITVHPPRLHLALESIISREVTIVPAVTGTPADGFEKYDITYSPLKSMLTGPRSRIEPIQDVTTENISIQGRQESVHVLTNLNIRDSLIHASPSGQVEVQVEIGVRRRRVTVALVPVMADDNSVTVTPSKVSVQVLVPENFDRPLTSDDLSATVSARKLDLTLPLVRVKPDVFLTHPMEPGIRVEETIPPLVTLRRVEKT